jgi:tetratricopeptide (TPR) repeat protein
MLVDPYTAEPGINPRLSSNEPPTSESKLLSTALMLEDKGNIKPSIKKYEQILSKYPDSPEAYVANARLPELYLQAERDVNELLMSYDEALESDVTTDKKFFKQMKITANTKSAKYDEAISIAEEMKAEAENEAEVTLADLSIAIAETMKNNGKSNDRTGSNTISDLLAKLTGKGGEEQADEPSDITESVLPSQHELFQNYPNPFNPVTQINFALSKLPM